MHLVEKTYRNNMMAKDIICKRWMSISPYAFWKMLRQNDLFKITRLKWWFQISVILPGFIIFVWQEKNISFCLTIVKQIADIV